MSELKFLPLGGMGGVTQNMFMYQYENEILLIDCGIGFPDMYMPGVDTLIPDVSYVLNQLEKGAHIAGMILSHGHDDHIGALPYILPELPKFPIYASSLTAGFAADRIKEKKLDREIRVIADGQRQQIGEFFSFNFVAVTHSVPDTKHIILRTPKGVIYHGSDFKLDKAPVDGALSDLQAMKQVGEEGVLFGMLDCLRIEEKEWTRSESSIEPYLEQEMQDVAGKVLVTLMSSHIHRIQQVVNACERLGRKVAFVGRSVEQNVTAATVLKKLHIPKDLQIDKKQIADTPDHRLCIIIAGSQGQEGSSLVRAVYGEHRIIQIESQDKVVFSANVIPGNEINYYAAIDELSANGVQVVYPEINPYLHASGHASLPEQKEVLSLLQARYLLPIGGADRHRALFRHMAMSQLNYAEKDVYLPTSGQVLSIDERGVKVVDEVLLQARAVDGLGIGDVGPIVLSDRLSLSKAGIIVLVIPKVAGRLELGDMQVVSRGFVFMKEADEVIQFIKNKVAEIIEDLPEAKEDEIKRRLERRLGRALYKVIQREPMIVPVIMEV